MKNLILFGFTSCGKTYFGKQLADSLQRPFLDTDHLLMARNGIGMSCREISLKFGESKFRELEHEVIASLKETQGTIISLGGGAILSEKNRKALEENGLFAYLEIDQETLKKRIFLRELPSFLDGSEACFQQYYQTRKPLYEGINAHRIPLLGKSDSEILEELRGLWHGQ